MLVSDMLVVTLFDCTPIFINLASYDIFLHFINNSIRLKNENIYTTSCNYFKCQKLLFWPRNRQQQQQHLHEMKMHFVKFFFLQVFEPLLEMSSNGISSKRISSKKISLNKISSNKISSNKISSNKISLNKISLNKISSILFS